MVINSSGNVGIGTSAPITDLTVRTDINGSEGGNLCLQNTGSGINTSVALYLTPNNGGGNDLLRTAAIKSRQEISGNYANLEFYTSQSNTPTERMRISNNGQVYIHTTTNFPGSGNTATGAMFEKSSDGTTFFVSRGDNVAAYFNRNTDGNLVRFLRSGNEVGRILINSSSTSYLTTSDHRLKENVVNISDGITRLKQLAPKRFNFIADADTTVDGFLAHEAQAVVPEAVHGTHNEVDDEGNPVMQGIDQAKLVPLLTAALQEAIAKIETLEIKVAALEAK